MNRHILITSLALTALLGCQTAPDCSPPAGFELGRDGQPAETGCEAADYQNARQLGLMLHELEGEYAELSEREDELNAAERMRLRVIEREIPELEGLARVQRLLEPASVPE